jgi:flagellar protein FlgJ
MTIPALHSALNAADQPIETLSGNQALSESEKVAEVCRQFETLLLRQILQQGRKTMFHSEFTSESATSAIYQDMVTAQLADSISRGGTFGLAKMLQSQLKGEISGATESSDRSKTKTNPAPAPAL